MKAVHVPFATWHSSHSASECSMEGKVFVGGLGDINEQDLEDYFGQFGTLDEVVVMRNNVKKINRGFGFVIFKDRRIAESVCTQKHEFKGRVVEAKLAVPPVYDEDKECQRLSRRMTEAVLLSPRDNSASTGGSGKSARQTSSMEGKVFVGGLGVDVNEDDLEEYFGQYGSLDDVAVMRNKMTRKSRGFGFVIFEDRKIAHSVCAAHKHKLKGRIVEAKLAVPPGARRGTVALQEGQTMSSHRGPSQGRGGDARSRQARQPGPQQSNQPQNEVERITDAERKKLLEGLKANWATVNKEYQALSFSADMPAKKKRMAEYEAQLEQIENDIKMLHM